MIHLRLFLVILMLVPVLALGACNTRTTKGNAAKDESYIDRTLKLYRIEIDYAAVKNGAQLLFSEPPPRAEFGLERRAQGFFSASERGFCHIVVRVAEPIVGLSGQSSEQRYDLINFSGRLSSDGTRANLEGSNGGAGGSQFSSNEVRFYEKDDDSVALQPFYDGKPTAYKYHFRRTPISRNNVPFPWR